MLGNILFEFFLIKNTSCGATMLSLIFSYDFERQPLSPIYPPAGHPRVHIYFPPDPQLRQMIDCLSEHVAEMGMEFEVNFSSSLLDFQLYMRKNIKPFGIWKVQKVPWPVRTEF